MSPAILQTLTLVLIVVAIGVVTAAITMLANGDFVGGVAAIVLSFLVLRTSTELAQIAAWVDGQR